MKKIIYLIAILFSVVSFSFFYSYHTSEHTSTYANRKENEKYPADRVFSVQFYEGYDQEDIFAFIELAQREAILVSAGYSDQQTMTRYYAGSADEINSLYSLLDYESLDFFDVNEEGYYSSDASDDQKSGYLFYINPSEKVIVKPLSQLADSEIEGAYFMINCQTKEQMRRLEEEIQEKFQDRVVINDNWSAGEGRDYQALKLDYCQTSGFLLAILLLLLIFAEYLAQAKEISIRNLHGQSGVTIIKDLFGKMLLTILALYFIIQAFLFFFLFRIPVNQYTIGLIQTCLVGFMALSAAELAVFGVMTVLANRISMINFIGNKRRLQRMMLASFALCGLWGVMMFQNNAAAYVEVWQRIENILSIPRNFPTLSFTSLSGYQGRMPSNQLYIELFQHYYDEGYLLPDLVEKTANPLIPIPIENNIDVYSVNLNVWEMLGPFHNEAGEPIIIDEQDSTTVLISSSLKEEASSMALCLDRLNQCEVIVCQEDIVVSGFDVRKYHRYFQSEPAILTVLTKQSQPLILDLSGVFYVPDSIDEINQWVKENSEESVQFNGATMEENLKQGLSHNLYYLKENGKYTLFEFLIYCCLLIQSLQFYFLCYRKEIAIRQYFGQRKSRIYRELIQMMILMLVPVCLSLMVHGNDMVIVMKLNGLLIFINIVAGLWKGIMAQKHKSIGGKGNDL